MTAATIGLLLFGVFFGLLFIGSPIMVALGLSTYAVYFLVGKDPVMLIQMAAASLSSFPLMALPSFILAGALMEASGMSRRLVNIAENIIGPMPGGLPVTTALACVFFGAISGSGPATTAAVGMLMIPAMTCRGYHPAYAAAAAATAGGVGILIPPSIPMVIYGVSGQQSITKMFMGGVLPGLLIAASLCAMHIWINRKRGGDGMAWSGARLAKSVKDGIWSIMAPTIILGGIYTGKFTPTEAAIVAIFYTLIIGCFVHRELKFKAFMAALKNTSWLAGRVLIIVFTAYSFGRILTEYRIPNELAEWVLSFTQNVNVVWFLVIVLLVFLGMFMETLAIIMLVTPVLLPVMMAYGVDPIHFGVILVCCCGVGFSTPPMGENMFIASGIADQSLEAISAKALPFVAVNLSAIALMVIFPQIVLWLPNLLSAVE